MKRRSGVIPFILCALAACSGKGDRKNLETVRISARTLLSTSPIFIADREGFFADEGIQLEFVEAPGRSVQALPLLAQGRIDVLSASLSAGLFSAARKDSSIRLVADRGHVSERGCEFDALVGRAAVFSTDSPRPSELKGKRFSINDAVPGEYIVDRFLASRGLTQKDITSTKLTEVLEPQALRSGAVDVAHVSEPFLTSTIESGQRIIGKASEYAPGMQLAVLMFGPGLIQKNRALGNRFMFAYLRGVEQFNKGLTSRNVAIISERMAFDTALLRKTCMPSIRPDGRLDRASLDDFQKWALQKGYIDELVPLNQVVDSTFASNAAMRLRAMNKTN